MKEVSPWSDGLERLAQLVTSFPELERTTKWGSDVYTFNGKNILSYGGFKHFFSLWFYNGVFIKDKYGVLVNASEGKTKSLRQWRFTSKDQIEDKKIIDYIRQAIEIERKGLKIQPEKFSPVPVPEVLKIAMKENPLFQSAFDRLTPGRQKEYIIYLNEAKQESTRMKRIEKIRPMILDGKGLNDKYKS